MLQLTCEATGNKDIEYRWIKDSSVYSDWSKTGALTVSQATKNEHGGYACIVRNLAGNLQSQVITVNVEGEFLYVLTLSIVDPYKRTHLKT